jgi:hypothetical protein
VTVIPPDLSVIAAVVFKLKVKVSLDTDTIVKPVEFSNVVKGNPPGLPSTFLSTTISETDLWVLISVTVTVDELAVKDSGSGPNIDSVAGSVLAGLAFCKPCGSAVYGLGSN